MSWGTAYQSRLKNIKKKQNNCLRCIFFAKKQENASPVYIILGILKIENIFKLKISSLVHKIKDRKRAIPTVISQELIISVSEIHKYNTRYAANQNLYRPASRTNHGLTRFKILSSKIWETIPSEIKLLPYNCFKKQLKLFLVTSQM